MLNDIPVGIDVEATPSWGFARLQQCLQLLNVATHFRFKPQFWAYIKSFPSRISHQTNQRGKLQSYIVDSHLYKTIQAFEQFEISSQRILSAILKTSHSSYSARLSKARAYFRKSGIEFE